MSIRGSLSSRTVLAVSLALAVPAFACAHHEPPSVDESPSAEATAPLAATRPFPPFVAHEPVPGEDTPALAVPLASAAHGSGDAGSAPAAEISFVPTDAAAAAAASEVDDPSDPTLPQTHEHPSASDPKLVARIDALWAAIMADDPSLATTAFFPLAAYQQVKAINNPASDWNHRLLAAFAEDIHALHKRLGARRSTAKLTSYDLPDTRARWVEPNEEYNKIGYFRVFGTTVRYREGSEDGDTTPQHDYSFAIASMISWRGQWYIVHLNSVR